jgi:hypothetical protein
MIYIQVLSSLVGLQWIILVTRSRSAACQTCEAHCNKYVWFVSMQYSFRSNTDDFHYENLRKEEIVWKTSQKIQNTVSRCFSSFEITHISGLRESFPTPTLTCGKLCVCYIRNCKAVTFALFLSGFGFQLDIPYTSIVCVEQGTIPASFQASAVV